MEVSLESHEPVAREYGRRWLTEVVQLSCSLNVEGSRSGSVMIMSVKSQIRRQPAWLCARKVRRP